MASLGANMNIKSPCYRELLDVGSKRGSRDQLQMRGLVRQVCQELVESEALEVGLCRRCTGLDPRQPGAWTRGGARGRGHWVPGM